MTNGNHAPPRAQTTNQPPPREQPLQPAPEVDQARPAAPLQYRAEFLLETEDGFHVLFTGEQLTPADAMVWIKRASAELKKQGFKPVRRDVQVSVAAAAPAPGGQAAAAAGEATWVKAEGGRPPRCSVHGPGKWMEGTAKTGPNTGKPYAFWACSVRDCKPKGNPT